MIDILAISGKEAVIELYFLSLLYSLRYWSSETLEFFHKVYFWMLQSTRYLCLSHLYKPTTSIGGKMYYRNINRLEKNHPHKYDRVRIIELCIFIYEPMQLYAWSGVLTLYHIHFVRSSLSAATIAQSSLCNLHIEELKWKAHYLSQGAMFKMCTVQNEPSVRVVAIERERKQILLYIHINSDIACMIATVWHSTIYNAEKVEPDCHWNRP